MAEKKKGEEKKGERKGGEKAKPKHLHKIIHTFAHDGSAMHEHVYKDHKDDHKEHPPQFMGTSDNIEDLMQHDADHAGPQMAAGGDEPQPGAQDPDPNAAAAGAGAPGAGTPPVAGV